MNVSGQRTCLRLHRQASMPRRINVHQLRMREKPSRLGPRRALLQHCEVCPEVDVKRDTVNDQSRHTFHSGLLCLGDAILGFAAPTAFCEPTKIAGDGAGGG